VVTQFWRCVSLARLSPQISRFCSRLFHVRFLVDKLALGQAFLQALVFPLSHCHPTTPSYTPLSPCRPVTPPHPHTPLFPPVTLSLSPHHTLIHPSFPLSPHHTLIHSSFPCHPVTFTPPHTHTPLFPPVTLSLSPHHTLIHPSFPLSPCHCHPTTPSYTPLSPCHPVNVTPPHPHTPLYLQVGLTRMTNDITCEPSEKEMSIGNQATTDRRFRHSFCSTPKLLSACALLCSYLQQQHISCLLTFAPTCYCHSVKLLSRRQAVCRDCLRT